MKQVFQQTWWDKNLQTKLEEFKGWVGDHTEEAKVYVRKHVEANNYKSIVDCGCGPATEFFGYKEDEYNIEYLGVDSSNFLIEHNSSRGVPMTYSSIEDIQLPDSSYEVAFSRAVCEHLPTYKNAISELIRVASKEAINVWFIKPDTEEEKIVYDKENNLYHNKYNKNEVEELLKSNTKVKSWRWEEINNKESVLFIQV